jgi:hypothetical protein
LTARYVLTPVSTSIVTGTYASAVGSPARTRLPASPMFTVTDRLNDGRIKSGDVIERVNCVASQFLAESRDRDINCPA